MLVTAGAIVVEMRFVLFLITGGAAFAFLGDNVRQKHDSQRPGDSHLSRECLAVFQYARLL